MERTVVAGIGVSYSSTRPPGRCHAGPMRHVEPPRPSDLPAVAALIAAEQRQPHRHVAYLSSDPEPIAAEVAALGDWCSASAVLRNGTEIEGFLAADVDDEIGRTWWLGPFVSGGDWRAGANALYGAIDPVHDQEEMAIDTRNVELAEFATSLGFSPEEPSAALVCRQSPEASPGIGLMRPVEAVQVAALHDTLFPGTHTTGRTLTTARPDHLVYVARSGDDVAGYVAVEVQEDGSGYIDFLGVAPDSRRQGLGRALVQTATRALFEAGVSHVHLTVRATNAAARRLYGSIGFEESRLLAPFRKGFSLDA